jgi:hypothetical protein
MKKSPTALIRGVGAAFLLAAITGIAGCGSGGSRPVASNSSAVSATPTPSATATPTATPTPTVAPSSAPARAAPPVVTTPPRTTAAVKPKAVVKTAPAAPPTVQAAPSPPRTAAPAPVPGCHPLTNGGSCYEPGEYCRKADHGVTGVAGDGKTITCEDDNGWRWEPV